MATKYDVIVVGAGPGGCSAAKTAAEKKLKVLMLERARTPGDKQVSGSYLWRGISEEIFPGFEAAPMHKGQIRIGAMDYRNVLDNDEKRYGFTLAPGNDAMRGMMTVYRNETDKWFAEQTVKAGAELKTALVTDVIWEIKGEEKRVKGVVTDKGNFEAPVVIDASGLHSTIAYKTGLARWNPDKICLGMKYIYKLDPEVLRERMMTYWDSDGTEVDWGCSQMLVGVRPDFFCAHATGMPGKGGIISVAFYSGLKEMLKYKHNIHQRAQWHLKQPSVANLIKGAEFIYFNVHGLAAGDIQGYATKSYLPGLMCVGDASGLADPPINFGANVAMWTGRMAANLVAEMKQKNDYSEAMFAKYEENWRNSFVGEDAVEDMCGWWRDGNYEQLLDAIDDIFGGFFRGYFDNKSYPACLLEALPKLAAVSPAIARAAGMVAGHVSGVGVKKANPLLGMLKMLNPSSGQ